VLQTHKRGLDAFGYGWLQKRGHREQNDKSSYFNMLYLPPLINLGEMAYSLSYSSVRVQNLVIIQGEKWVACFNNWILLAK
jgi:hypothetical protein